MYVFCSVLLLLLSNEAYCAKVDNKPPGKSLNLSGGSTQAPAIGNIIGGSYAAPGQFPYQISVQINAYGTWQHICGGSIYTSRYIITAAHCLYDSNTKQKFTYQMSILAGTNDVYSGGQRFTIKNTIAYPSYDYNTPLYYDIGLLVTSSSITFTNLIKPVTISNMRIFPGKPVTVSGWGRDSRLTNSISQSLKYFDTLTGNCVMPDNQMCTYDAIQYQAGYSTCYGDSGGPLVNTNSSILVGIVSYEMGICDINMQNHFTRVSSFYNWIMATAV